MSGRIAASGAWRYGGLIVNQSPIGNRWHPRLVEAAVALNENRLDVAERLLKPHLKEDPFDAAAIRMLAELAGRIGRWRDAENLLRRAVELAPGRAPAKPNLSPAPPPTARPPHPPHPLHHPFPQAT